MSIFMCSSIFISFYTHTYVYIYTVSPLQAHVSFQEYVQRSSLFISLRFSRQEYWSVLPRPPPGDLPDPEIKPTFLVSPALACGSLPLALPGKPIYIYTYTYIIYIYICLDKHSFLDLI